VVQTDFQGESYKKENPPEKKEDEGGRYMDIGVTALARRGTPSPVF
jgi:hypothetical protein